MTARSPARALTAAGVAAAAAVAVVAAVAWTTSLAANNAVVTGVMQGYQRSGYKVGFYSSTYMWNKILGAAGPKRYPEWRTAGATSWAGAARMCTHGGFAGGKAVMGQWWTATKDHDQVCPAFATTTSRRAFFGHA